MTVPTVNKCCCFRLKTGGILISLVEYVISAVILFYYLRSWLYDEYSNLNLCIFVATVLYSIYRLVWIFGIFKEDPNVLKPLVCLSFICTVAFIIYLFAALYYYSFQISIIYVFIIFCIVSGVVCYSWVIQYSLYKQLKNREIERDLNRPPVIQNYEFTVENPEQSEISIVPTIVKPSAPEYSDDFQTQPNMFFEPVSKSKLVEIELHNMNSSVNDEKSGGNSKESQSNKYNELPSTSSGWGLSASHESLAKSNVSTSSCYEPD